MTLIMAINRAIKMSAEAMSSAALMALDGETLVANLLCGPDTEYGNLRRALLKPTICSGGIC